MRKVKNTILALAFNIGVNCIGMPEFHAFTIKLRSWTTAAAKLLILSLLLTQCGKKPIISTDNQEIKDSIREHYESNTDRSKAIDEQILIPVPVIRTSDKNCDSLALLAMDEFMQKLNYQKVSGDNRFQLMYDKYNRLLVATANIGATENKATKKSQDRYFLKTRTVTNNIPVKFIPDFIKYSAWFGWLVAAYLAFRLIKKIYSLWQPKLLTML